MTKPAITRRPVIAISGRNFQDFNQTPVDIGHHLPPPRHTKRDNHNVSVNCHYAQDIQRAREGACHTPLHTTKFSAAQPDQMHFPTESPAMADDNLFFTDVHGEEPTPVELVDYTPPNPDTSSSIDSSEDEVIFNGRGGSRSARVNTENTTRVRAKDVPTSVQVTTLEENTLVANTLLTREAVDPIPMTLRNISGAQKKKHSRQRFQQAFFAQNDDAAILADYVANMDSQYALSDNSSTSDDVSDDLSELSDENPAKMRRAVAFKQKNTRKPKGASSENDLPELINSTGKKAMELADNSTDDEDFDDSDVSVSLSDLISYSQRRPTKVSRAKNMTQKLPRTNAYDDLLDYKNFADFDIMDLERDSLHKKKKKKKGRKLDFDLSDSDLEMQLQEGWERDRNKKKAKKQEREQLRAQGLLGKRSKLPADGAGITMEEVKTQVKGFLLSSADTLDLPPMDKKQRRIVHELANAVSLKSQSRGGGSTRYPVMYKTVRTPNFNGKHIVKLDKILSQSRFVKIGNMRPPRNYDKEPKKGKNIQRSKGDFGYIEGDVVGGAAPEIAANNKGRAMLEKMGWSSGTALGAMNNKGILQPVTQVMKNSRAGLG